MVECNLAKVEVAGSNPVSRSKNIQSFYKVDGYLPRLSHVLSHVVGALLLYPLIEVIPKVPLNRLPVLFQPFGIPSINFVNHLL